MKNNRKVLCIVIGSIEQRNLAERPHLAKKKVLFHQDNESTHKGAIAIEKLHELRYQLLCHPLYSPDLAPSDFFLFPNIEKWPTGKKFISNEEAEWDMMHIMLGSQSHSIWKA